MEFWKEAWRSIFRRPSRSCLTILGISIGIFAVMLIGTIGEIGKRAVFQELSSLGLSSLTLRIDSESSAELNRDQLEMIRHEHSVADAIPLLADYSSASIFQNRQKAVVWGVDANLSRMLSLKMKSGREISRQDVLNTAAVCVMEETLANRLFGRDDVIGRKFDISLEGSELTAEIIGVAEAGGSLFQSMMGNTVPSFLYLPYTTYQRYTGREDFDRIAVRLAENADKEKVKTSLLVKLNTQLGQSDAVAADDLSEYTAAFTRLLDMVTKILSAIAGISLLVAGLSVMTAMLSSVGERTREIGIKKSLGASSRLIVTEFLLESAVLTLIGSIIGILFGFAAGWIGCLITGFSYHFPFSLAGICIISALLTGILFGAYPARCAASLRPVEALR